METSFIKNSSFKKIILGVLGVIASAFFSYLCFRDIHLKNIWKEILSVSPIYFLLSLFLIFSIPLIKTLQWKIFLTNTLTMSTPRLFQLITIWLMAVNLLPFWSGDAFAVYLLGHREKIGKIKALSIITLDHIAEGFSSLAIYLFIAWTIPLPPWFSKGIKSVTLLVLGAYFILLILAQFHKEIKTLKILSKNYLKKINHLISEWAYHLNILRSFQKTFFSIFFSVLIKGVEILALIFLEKGLGVNLPYWSAFLVIGALNLALIIPVAPANLGVFEATIFFIYQFLGLSPIQALSLAILYRVVYFSPFIISGIPGGVLILRKNDQIEKN